MKVKQRVLKNGGALYVCVPKMIAEAMGLEKGAEIEVIRIEGGFMVTRPEARDRDEVPFD